MTAIVPLSSWYPTMYDQWVREGRRLWAGIAVRTGWMVHHTAGGVGQDARRYARWVASYHYGKWRRPGGYNFFIPEDGTILEMCSWDWIGAHAPGANTSDIGVAFQGTFESRMPNRQQQAAFAALVGMGRVPNRQRGHRDVSSTSCPGRTLHRALPLSVTTPPAPAPPELLPVIEEDDMRLIHLDRRGGTAYVPDVATKTLLPLNARWQADAVTGDPEWPSKTVVVPRDDVAKAGWTIGR